MKFLMLGNSDELQQSNEKASIDAMYEQLYEEMRRHRDYELKIAIQTFTLVIAILGVLTSLRFSEFYTDNFGKIFPYGNLIFLIIIGFVISLIIGSGIAIVNYSHKTYDALRKYTNGFEPSPKFIKENDMTPPYVLINVALFSLFPLLFIVMTLFWGCIK